MPAPAEIDLTIRHVPLDVFERLKQNAEQKGQSVEAFVLDLVEEALPGEVKPANTSSVRAQLDRIRKIRDRVAERGSILLPGETWKDLARQGLRDARRGCRHLVSPPSIPQG